jgi:cell division protein ZapA
MKNVDVTIMGHGYRLTCEEGGEAELMQAVAAVDRQMSAIRDAGRVKARDRIAVLAALNLAAALPGAGEGAAAAATPSAPSVTSSKVKAGQRPPARGTGDAPDTTLDAAIDALITRLDAALGDDGRLL